MNELTPGPALDARIAERVMGWHRDGAHWRMPDGDLYITTGGGAPPLSTDIAAAWWVVEHLRAARHLYCKITDHWTEDYGVWAYFDDQGVADAHPLYPGHAETVPHAICLAALAAVESEAPHD